jgi:two-component system, CAI-1 autoinducer sensor kinase/phosphatase CqsS
MRDGIRYSEPHLAAIGSVGVLGFPLYYYVWEYLFPQPYENLGLRIIGMLLFVPFTLINRWPANWRPWLPAYWAVAVVYTLPFFFTFMLLKNDMSLVWSMSMMAAIFLLVMVVNDWIFVILFYLFGSVLGWAAYILTTETTPDMAVYTEQMPIYFFEVVAGAIFNYRRSLLHEEKLDGMLAISRSIAHELRTPLLGIRSGIGGLHRYLSPLMDGYEQARAAGLPVTPIRQAHYTSLQNVLARIENEANYTNIMIDMLLVNAGRPKLETARTERHSIQECITMAIQRYPFKSTTDRNRVQLIDSPDFQFTGSNVLIVHVLFNLLKNALHFIAKAGDGRIEIWTATGKRYNRLFFRDTGTGISSSDLPRIFDRFYSTSDSGVGAGIGLYFCQMVMNGIGGNIACRSRQGQYTEFELTLPGIENAQGE